MNTHKIKKYKELSSDLTEKDLLEIEDGELKSKSSEKWEIESVIDVFMDPKDLKIKESGLVAINANLSNNQIKRGELIYITAMVRKEGQSFSSPATQAVIKLRVVDIYHGLSYLNKLIK
jgi:hypothetical protein